MTELTEYPQLKMYGDLIIQRDNLRCREHDVLLVAKILVIKSGYREVIRKVMLMGRCPDSCCTTWCELTVDMVIWS